ncbi:hypothetical protein BLOT_005707 [Blomia tropicalis]|nr:hypothetical protein BLOT_005707 [Blomia tropicalis]
MACMALYTNWMINNNTRINRGSFDDSILPGIVTVQITNFFRAFFETRVKPDTSFHLNLLFGCSLKPI